jgi:hypothetical protein
LTQIAMGLSSGQLITVFPLFCHIGLLHLL